MTELRECPFCGGEAFATTEQEYREERHVIKCRGCDLVVYESYCTEEPPVEAWNKRAENKLLQELKTEQTKWFKDRHIWKDEPFDRGNYVMLTRIINEMEKR